MWQRKQAWLDFVWSSERSNFAARMVWKTRVPFHAVLLKYVPKRLHFDEISYIARTRLAILDWNFNVGRPRKTNVAGEYLIAFNVSASACEWRARFVAEDI